MTSMLKTRIGSRPTAHAAGFRTRTTDTTPCDEPITVANQVFACMSVAYWHFEPIKSDDMGPLEPTAPIKPRDVCVRHTKELEFKLENEFGIQVIVK